MLAAIDAESNTSGLEIILCLMQRMGMDRLTVSDSGILEGLLLSLHKVAVPESFR